MESVGNGKILNLLGLYLKRDVWLWAGAYQTFRNESENSFKLEPLLNWTQLGCNGKYYWY